MIDPSRCVVLVDRDGTINREKHHLSDPEDVELLPGAAEGLRRLHDAGLPLVVVTNQAQIGRGLLTESRLQEIHQRLSGMLCDAGVRIQSWHWCPHRPEEKCACRKPQPGMLRRAIDELGVTLERRWMIGDKLSDLQAGRAVAATGILVATGYGEEESKLPAADECVDHYVPTLSEAADLILQELSSGVASQTIAENAAVATDADQDSQHLQYAQQHLTESAETKRRYAADSAGQLVEVARLVADSMQASGKLMLCGNGGSAADCQHIAAEFVSVLSQTFDRRALPALALTTDTSYLTARTNDYGFDDVFSRQVEALGKPGDTLFGTSTSGNSKNVLRAFEVARQQEIKTVAFTGAGGGKMNEAADIVLRAPSDCVQHIQECHIAMGHIIVAIAEKHLFLNGPY